MMIIVKWYQQVVGWYLAQSNLYRFLIAAVIGLLFYLISRHYKKKTIAGKGRFDGLFEYLFLIPSLPLIAVGGIGFMFYAGQMLGSGINTNW